MLRAVGAYSKELLDEMSIQAVLRVAEQRQHDLYANVYPMLLSLVVSHYPQLFGVTALVQELEQRTRYLIAHTTARTRMYTRPRVHAYTYDRAYTLLLWWCRIIRSCMESPLL